MNGLMARHLQVSHESEASRHSDKVDAAARYLVYNLFVAISEMPEGSHLLRDIDVSVEILARAVERGWVDVFERRRNGAVVRLVALTDEGRRIVRRSFH
jgi:hypothetical protein